MKLRATRAATSSVLCCSVLLVVTATVARADDLYAATSYDALAADHRALRIGDNVTIVVTEIASATADARTSFDKAFSLTGSYALHNRTGDGKLAANNTYDGGAQTERTDKLIARLTVSVVGIEPDASLRVKGQQEIVINGERQKFLLEGRVRTLDIGPDNTVLSSRLSDAKISYTGRGVLNDSQRAGLIPRLLGWLRLF